MSISLADFRSAAVLHPNSKKDKRWAQISGPKVYLCPGRNFG